MTKESHLKSQMDQVQQGVGSTTDQMIAQCKPKIINTFPDWQHPELLDLQIRYNASLLTERREGL
jgi:hypothetical protein